MEKFSPRGRMVLVMRMDDLGYVPVMSIDVVVFVTFNLREELSLTTS